MHDTLNHSGLERSVLPKAGQELPTVEFDPQLPETSWTLESILGSMVLVAIFLAYVLIDSLPLGLVAGESLQLLGATLIGLVPIALAVRLRRVTLDSFLFAFSGFCVICSQIFEVTEDLPYCDTWPVLGRHGAYSWGGADSALLAFGLLTLACSTYASVMHANRSQRKMELQRAHLSESLAITQAYAAALLKSERRFMGLADEAPIIIWTADVQGEVLYLNKAWHEATGTRPEEGLGGKWLSFVHPEDRERVLVLNKRVREMGTAIDIQYRLRTATGGYRQYRGRTIPIPEDVLGTRGYLGCSVDITDFVESKEAYEAIVSNAQQGMMIIQDDRIVFANEAMGRIVGMPYRDFIGFTIEQVTKATHREDRDALGEDYRELLAGSTTRPIRRWRIFRPDGSMRWVQTESIAIRFRGRPAAQSLVLDMTEKTAAETALRASEERLQLIVEATKDGIYDVRPQENHWWYSDRYSEIFGEAARFPATNSYQTWLERLHPDDRDSVLAGFADTVESNARSWQSTHRMRRNDGSYGYFSDHCIIEKDSEGNVARCVGAVKDVSEEEYAVRRLEAIAEVAQLLLNADEGDASLQAISATLCQRLNFRCGAAMLYDAAAHEFSMNGYYGPVQYAYQKLRLPADNSLFTPCFASSEIVHTEIDAAAASPTEAEIAGLLGVQESLLVPLSGQEGLIGVLVLGSAGPIYCDDSLRQTLEIVGNTVTQWLVRTRTRRALRLSQKRYLLATAAASVGVLDWEVGSDTFYVDPVLEKLVGYESEDHRWKLSDLESVLSEPDQIPEMYRRLSEHVEGNTPEYRMEISVQNRFHGDRWFLMQGTAVRDESGVARRFIGTATDITETKRAEADAQFQRRQLLLLANNLPALVSYVGPDHGYRFCNACYLDWYGIAPASLVGKHIVDLLGEHEFIDIRVKYERAAHGERIHFIRQMEVGTRGLRWLSIELIPVPTFDGGFDGYVILTTDITDFKRAQEAVMNSQHLLAESQRIGHIGSWIWKPGAREIESSAELFRIHGLPVVDNPMASTFLRLIHPDDKSVVKEFALGHLADGTSGEHMYRIVRPDGQERVLRILTEFKKGIDGETKFMTGVTQDVTEQVDLEERVIEATESERRRFGEDLHDDIGQYLTGLVMLARSLARTLREQNRPESTSAEEIEHHIQHCRERARAVARGLRPIPDESNGLVVALQNLCADLEDLFKITCTLDRRGDANVDDLTAATHLFRIAQEAATNAVHHGHATSVRIVLQNLGARFILLIEDNGCGMPDVPSVADGNGLTIMHHRASLLRGVLTVENAQGGKGVRVTCAIPTTTLSGRRTA